jgi:hypothetical protein
LPTSAAKLYFRTAVAVRKIFAEVVWEESSHFKVDAKVRTALVGLSRHTEVERGER